MKEEKEKKLTTRQKRFCEEYVIDWNGTRAAIAAGYSEKTATAIASENIRKPFIASYINKLKPLAVLKLTNVLNSKSINDNGFVYLIHCKGTNFYKIGKSRRNVKHRLSELQSMSPFELDVIAIIEVLDSTVTEKEIHLFFNKEKVRGEWFEFTSKSLEFIIKKIYSYGR